MSARSIQSLKRCITAAARGCGFNISCSSCATIGTIRSLTDLGAKRSRKSSGPEWYTKSLVTVAHRRKHSTGSKPAAFQAT
eukprot:8626460-Karenia_brevis.AAC.1